MGGTGKVAQTRAVGAGLLQSHMIAKLASRTGWPAGQSQRRRGAVPTRARVARQLPEGALELCCLVRGHRASLALAPCHLRAPLACSACNEARLPESKASLQHWCLHHLPVRIAVSLLIGSAGNWMRAACVILVR